MYVNVTLYKTKLSPTDTMVFSSKEEQTTFFNGLTKLDLGQCSFNGKRTIRINGNYFMLNIGGYNYIKIYYTDGSGNERTYYAFIDLFRYVNDNCCEVDVTTDYIQTYMFDIQFAQLFIEQRNYSLNIEDFPRNYQFKNKYPVANNKEIFSDTISPNYLVVTVLVNRTGDLTNIKPISFPVTKQDRDNKFTTQDAVGCCMWVYEYTETGYRMPQLTFKDIHTNNPQISLLDFLTLYSANILDITINDIIGRGIQPSPNGLSIRGIDYETITIKDKNYCYINTLAIIPEDQVILPSANIKLSLYTSPYYNMYFYRKGRSVNLINPSNIEWFENLGNLITNYRLYPGIFPNYSTIIEFVSNINKTELFSIDSYAENIVFNVSAWEQYKLTNSATVGDALSTKHAYDLEIAERNKENARNRAATNMGSGVTNTLGAAVNSFAKGAASGAKGGLISGGISAITNLITGSVNTGLAYEQELENADVAYQNTLTTVEQESALLQLQYDNIKNSPDQVKNLSGNGYLDVAVDRRAKIAIYEATNINEIIKYHKRFGFETSLQTEITDLAGLHDTNAQDFDYIRTLNCAVISENIPRTSADMIQKIFNSGIYLWRNYEKLGEDYLSNYEGE